MSTRPDSGWQMPTVRAVPLSINGELRLTSSTSFLIQLRDWMSNNLDTVSPRSAAPLWKTSTTFCGIRKSYHSCVVNLNDRFVLEDRRDVVAIRAGYKSQRSAYDVPCALRAWGRAVSHGRRVSDVVKDNITWCWFCNNAFVETKGCDDGRNSYQHQHEGFEGHKYHSRVAVESTWRKSGLNELCKTFPMTDLQYR